MYIVDNITCVVKSSDALMINKANLSFEKICFDENVRIESKEVIFEVFDIINTKCIKTLWVILCQINQKKLFLTPCYLRFL